MADENAFANALLAALQRQRNEASNKLAQAEANIAVLETATAKLAAENAKLREETKASSYLQLAQDVARETSSAPEVTQDEE